MKRSEDRILTTHVGALPRPQELGAPARAKTYSEAHDEAKLAAWLRSAVGDGVARAKAERAGPTFREFLNRIEVQVR